MCETASLLSADVLDAEYENAAAPYCQAGGYFRKSRYVKLPATQHNFPDNKNRQRLSDVRRSTLLNYKKRKGKVIPFAGPVWPREWVEV